MSRRNYIIDMAFILKAGKVFVFMLFKLSKVAMKKTHMHVPEIESWIGN